MLAPARRKGPTPARGPRGDAPAAPGDDARDRRATPMPRLGSGAGASGSAGRTKPCATPTTTAWRSHHPPVTAPPQRGATRSATQRSGGIATPTQGSRHAAQRPPSLGRGTGAGVGPARITAWPRCQLQLGIAYRPVVRGARRDALEGGETGPLARRIAPQPQTAHLACRRSMRSGLQTSNGGERNMPAVGVGSTRRQLSGYR